MNGFIFSFKSMVIFDLLFAYIKNLFYFSTICALAGMCTPSSKLTKYDFNPLGTNIVFNFLLFENAHIPILTPQCNSTDVRLLQSLKAQFPIVLTFLGI